MINLKKILYPTDFSEFSLCALPYATELAGQFNAQLHCLHVVDETYQYALGAGDGAVPIVISIEEMMASAQKEFTQFIDTYLAPQRDRLITRLTAGRPFLEIIRYAREQEIDLIVLATHGRGGLASMLLGSVTEKVVRKSPCPVLTIRHAEHKFVMP